MPDPSLFRSKTIGVHVTEDDYARLQVMADAQGKTVGEWCRDVLSEIAQNPGGKTRPIDHALLAEVMALRTIVANLTYAFTSDGKVTRERMLAVMDRADKTKVKRAAGSPRSAATENPESSLKGQRKRSHKPWAENCLCF